MVSPSRTQSLPNGCVLETPIVSKSRKRVHDSVTNLRSQKRRRISMPATLGGAVDADILAGSSKQGVGVADRFISTRPKTYMPLNITPRTNRISKQFGLVDDRVLNFGDKAAPSMPIYKDDSTMSLLRRSASSLFNTPPVIRSTSVTENLNKRRQSLMVLDSPGVPLDHEAFPISWSGKNLIAVACKNDIYYQNLDTKSVSHLCTTSHPGKLGVIRWGGENRENQLALGLSTGFVAVWDAGTKGGTGVLVHKWPGTEGSPGVKSLSWNQDVLAMGMENGEISMVDLRAPSVISKTKKHRTRVLGLEWSTNKIYLASGDKDGMVHIWDRRVGKSLLDVGNPITKIRHKGSTRALAWCPWKSDLLATGSAAPEGKISIWSTSSISAHSPAPIHTIPLNTSVLSLIWSPHCKELLSTHGSSFMPLLSSRHRTLSVPAPVSLSLRTNPNVTANTIVDTFTPPGTPGPGTSRIRTPAAPKLQYTKTSLSNSIVVHEYPSCKRLLTLTNAHAAEVTQSCLGPSGERVFTLCPAEEAIKMWQVWSTRPLEPRRESAFDKFTIR